VLRIDRGPGTLTLVSRFSRPRALAILAGALVVAALLCERPLPALAAFLGVLALLVAVLGGRAVRAAFARGRVQVSPPVPLGRGADRPLGDFSGVRVETLAEARRRKAERRARAYRDRAGADLPSWLVPSDVPGANDQLRRLVLEPRGGEPLAVTAWLAEDDLEPARAAVADLLGG
jgi:hypothetical protein